MKNRKYIELRVRLSDMEHMGAIISVERLVETTILSKKYISRMMFEDTLYYIYVRYGFYSGARISGIAAPFYANREYALLACKRLNESYQNAMKRNQNNIRRKRRKWLWGEVAVHLVFMIVAVMYCQRAFMVWNNGLSMTSFVLSILYSIIVALCYMVHYRLQ